MEKENCKVTIVIPNYKGKDYLGQCVKSLYTEDNTRKEIIIVDTRYISPKILNNYINFKYADILFLYGAIMANNSYTIR